MKPIFEYMNYREFLRDFYNEKKRKTSFYSYRLFSQKAGFKAPNFLKLVIDGARNLSKESVYKFVKALGLRKAESAYFENLVFFNQSKTLDEKNLYLKALMKHRRRTDPRKIEESEFAYYSAWWHPVIRELVVADDFGEDYKRLGNAVIPAISASDAQKSVELLVKLGFVARNDDGSYVSASSILTTGPRVRSVAVANYHKEMMKLASEAIERFGADERDITSLTLGVSEETQKTIVEKLQRFRRELLELADADKEPSRVVQMNFQLFPLSQQARRKGGRR